MTHDPSTPSSDAPSDPGSSPTPLTVVREKTQTALEQGQHYARSHPVPMVLGALTLGLLAGVAMGRQCRREPDLGENLREWWRSSFKDFSPRECCKPSVVREQAQKLSGKLRFW